MMKSIKLTFILSFAFMVAHSQVRPDVGSLTTSQLNDLTALMQEYITLDVVQDHCDYTTQSGSANVNIHDDFNFLPFHRVYIEAMEEFMLLKGHPEFVPLPKWDQSSCLPSQLRVIDLICSNLGPSTCGNVDPGWFNCNTPNWCPSNPFPYYLSTNIQSGANNDICDWQFSPTVPGGSNNNGLSHIIEGDGGTVLGGQDVRYHNRGHFAMGGVMGLFTSPVLPAFWLWHANVDDVWKSWEENCTQSTTSAVDLYMKDRNWILQEERDRGEEPNIDNGPMWVSSDIWIRNQSDGFSTDVHEDPIATPGNPVYVYVRIRNRGFEASIGTEEIELRWAKAATSLGWPNHWNGSMDLDPSPTDQALAGDLIDVQTINSIVAGGHTIIEFPWYPPNPSDYSDFNSEPWHFCLLARIVASNDPMTFTETGDLNGNVKNNNNIVWKNVNVVDNIPGIVAGGGGNCHFDVMQSIGDAVAVGNPLNVEATFDIEFEVPKEDLPIQLSGMVHRHTDFSGTPHTMVEASTLATPDRGIPVNEEGMVVIALDEDLYDKWKQGGALSEGLNEINAHNTRIGQLLGATELHDIIFESHRKLFEVTDKNAKFKNITLQAGDYHTTSMMVLYPTSPTTAKELFIYDINQINVATGEAIGGVRYDIRKPDCVAKFVGAGQDEVIKRGCTVDLKAAKSLPCAVYRWSDEQGNIVARTEETTVRPLTTTTYNLYVVSSDGCVSNDEVTITVDNRLCLPEIANPRCFSNVSVYPNPTGNENIKVSLMAEGPTTLQFTIVHALLGNELSRFKSTVDEGLNIIPIDISEFRDDSFHLIIDCGDGETSPPYYQLIINR